MEEKIQLLTTPYPLRRADHKNSRFYYERNPDGSLSKYIGITSLAERCIRPAKELILWQREKDPDGVLLERASELGTIMHLCIDAFDRNEPWRELIPADYPHTRHIEGAVLAWKKFRHDYEVEIVASEIMLRYVKGDVRFAATLDKICYITETEKVKQLQETGKVYKSGKNKGQPKMKSVTTEKKKSFLAIVDLKSNYFEKDSKSFYEAHQFQLWGQMLALRQSYPEIKGIRMFNWAPNSWRVRTAGLDNIYTLYEWTKDYSWKFGHLMAEAVHENWMEATGRVEVFEDFTMETPIESAYRAYTYDEYVNYIEQFQSMEAIIENELP